MGPEPWTPEAVGFLDLVASLFEVLLIAVAVMLLRGDSIPARPHVRLERPPLAVFTGAVTAITYMALIGGHH